MAKPLSKEGKKVVRFALVEKNEDFLKKL